MATQCDGNECSAKQCSPKREACVIRRQLGNCKAAPTHKATPTSSQLGNSRDRSILFFGRAANGHADTTDQSGNIRAVVSNRPCKSPDRECKPPLSVGRLSKSIAGSSRFPLCFGDCLKRRRRRAAKHLSSGPTNVNPAI